MKRVFISKSRDKDVHVENSIFFRINKYSGAGSDFFNKNRIIKGIIRQIIFLLPVNYLIFVARNKVIYNVRKAIYDLMR